MGYRRTRDAGESTGGYQSLAQVHVRTGPDRRRTHFELSPGTGIIYEDPQFINLEQLNFELSDTSPCINSGDPEQELDNDGTISDIGANTYNNQFCSDLGDLNYDNNIDVVDVIVLVNCILLNENCSICFDINQDNEFNILDILDIINIIIN